MARLSIRLLGPYQIALYGQPVTAFESDKVRALLAFLAVESERAHRRETLAGLLWPGDPWQAATLTNPSPTNQQCENARAVFPPIAHQRLKDDRFLGESQMSHLSQNGPFPDSTIATGLDGRTHKSLARSDSSRGAFYRRIRAKHGAPKAITATAHKLARTVYFMLKRKEPYCDPGADYYEEQYRARVVRSLERKAAKLGLRLEPTPAT